MAVFRCKMCGANLNIEPDEVVVVCDYCDTKQTVPMLDSEKKTNLYNRANRLRMGSEFDKAAGLYESIIAEFPEEAEAYWGLCLCNYGIEYVDDPATAKKVPTCHRASFEKLANDENFKLAIEYSDVVSQKVYRDEAREIDRIMEEILSLSRNEKPYDVFICYKETDDVGSRTIDSVLAQDIYDALTAKGLRVFFSRISLEDKLGQMYEPYIFAALNSAKVMLCVGTKYEHFHAVWVKNEWSRFIKLMAKDKSKMLIPCYKDMDAYDLPEEFKMLQAQDMGKIGFMQDLVRGVQKILNDGKAEPQIVKETVVVPTAAAGSGTEPLLRRAFMFLEDGDWRSADEYCEKVLDIEPENAEAYLGKLMAEVHVTKRENLKNLALPFNNNKNFEKAVRFGGDGIADELNGYIKFIVERNETNRLEGLYTDAVKAMNGAKTEGAYIKAATSFKAIEGYKNSDELAEKCLEKAEIVRKDDVYTKAKAQMKILCFDRAIEIFKTIPGWKDSDEQIEICQNKIKDIIYNEAKQNLSTHMISDIEYAITLFEKIRGWKDADEQIEICKEKIKEIEAQREADRIERQKIIKEKAEKLKKLIIKGSIAFAAVMVVVIAIVVYFTTVKLPNEYKAAVAFAESGDYQQAIDSFAGLGDYKDSKEQMLKSKYLWAIDCRENGDYEKATTLFTELSSEDYKDSGEQTLETKYLWAIDCRENGDYEKATTLFTELSSEDYKDSGEQGHEVKYLWAIDCRENGDYEKATTLFTELSSEDYKDSGEQVLETKYLKAVFLEENGCNEEAIVIYSEIIDYKDSSERIGIYYYTVAVEYEIEGDFANAAINFGKAGDYSDARERSFNLWDKIAVRETVSADQEHTVGLKSDGTVVAVGYNDYGQCDVDGWADIVAVSAGRYHTVGLKSDGTVVATEYTGDYYDGQCDVDGWTNIVVVSAYGDYTVGLKSDGTVVAVGSNGYGRCDVEDWTDIVAVSAGGYHTVGLKSDGTVVAVGWNNCGQCDVDGWTDIVAVSAGTLHTVGLKSDGTVVATEYTGDSYDGQCDVDGWTDIVAVSAGALHTVGLKSDGTVVAVGSNDYGRCDVDGWMDIVAVSAGHSHTVGLKADGTVVATEYTGYSDYYEGQCDVEGWTNIKIPE